MKRIAIVGTGSLGTILGAYLSKAGLDVELIDANQAHVDALNEKGAQVIGKTEMLVPVVSRLPQDMTGIYDLIILGTKQTHNEVVFKQINQVINDDSYICTIQNGIPEIPVAREFGAERTLGAPVGWGATWVGPGVSELTSDVPEMFFTLGTFDGTESPALIEVKEVLEKMTTVEISDNLMGLRWAKLLINATFSGLSTVMGGIFGDILEDERALRIAARIGKETIQVCEASGIKMEPSHGMDLAKKCWYEEDEEESFETYQAFFSAHRKLKASMLQDIEKGLRTEIDAINGVVCDEGRRFNVPTPTNDLVREIIKKIENKEMTASFDNIDLFYK